MQIQGCVSADVGRRRKKSADAAALKVATSGRYGKIGFAVLCDGVEEADGAGEASTIVAERLAQWFQEELPKELQAAERRVRERAKGSKKARVLTEVLRADERRRSFSRQLFDEAQEPLCERLNEIAEELNVRIAGYGRLHGKRMGTAATCLLVMGGEYLLMRVGAAKAYLARADALKSLTERSADSYDATQPSFGAKKQIAPVFVRGSLEKSAGVLLCSDGFFRRQDPEKLRKKIGKFAGRSERRMESALKSLTRFARRRGEDEDAFAVYLGVQ